MLIGANLALRHTAHPCMAHRQSGVKTRRVTSPALLSRKDQIKIGRRFPPGTSDLTSASSVCK